MTCDLKPPTLYYVVGQASLGLEIRAGDERIKSLTQALVHWPSDRMCKAERACLRVLEGGCSVPVGVSTSLVPVNDEKDRSRKAERCLMIIIGTVTGLEGTPHVEQTIKEEIESPEEVEAIGRKLAKVLIENGAAGFWKK